MAIYEKIDTISDYCSTWVKVYETRNAGDREMTLRIVQKATASFVGNVDLPPYDFMPELIELYPDAKVVLVRRDPVKVVEQRGRRNWPDDTALAWNYNVTHFGMEISPVVCEGIQPLDPLTGGVD